MKPQLFDITNYSADTKEGARSVSEGKVIYGKLAWMSEFAVETVCCIEHGGLNSVAIWKDGTILWRCQACHEGCVTKNVT